MPSGDSIQGNRYRQRRFKDFVEVLDRFKSEARQIRILDLGGRPQYWESLRPLWEGRDLKVTMVNLNYIDVIEHPMYEYIQGNACNLAFPDNSFDIVHSNSVIEHVGSWSNMRSMAAEVRRIAPYYFIQTPNFWFPIEMHYRYPFMQILPESMRASLLMKKGRGFLKKVDTLDQAMEVVQSIQLLNAKQMRTLFPDATIKFERVFGLGKSIMAIR